MPERIDLDPLEAKAKAATPGPWMLDGMGEDEPEINYWAHRFIGTAEPNESGSHEVVATSEDGHGPNAEYIAAAHPAVILALVSELRTARAAIAACVPVLEQARSDIVQIEGEWGGSRGWDALVAAGDEDAVAVVKAEALIAELGS
ncbi:ead/Ea22-like family protein [Microbacterium sp. NPDC089696]|uniref:ead/Ea22-like family protein n=1 Tax=Microbacterium sp. NPDC089696 TaxID=3364199 RepID=UPI0037F8407E